MKMVHKILFAIIFLILIKVNCKALTYGGCDYNTISNLKKLVSNINISYTYEIIDNEAYFNVILNNIPDNVYFTDSNSIKQYSYPDTINGEITIQKYNNIQGGKYTFYVNNNVCNNIKLGTKYYNFPIYNRRRNSELCKDIPNFYLCKRWILKDYSDEEFSNIITEYRKSLKTSEENVAKIKYNKDIISKIVNFYIKYYYYFLPAIILPCILIIAISNKKQKFKL